VVIFFLSVLNFIISSTAVYSHSSALLHCCQVYDASKPDSYETYTTVSGSIGNRTKMCAWYERHMDADNRAEAVIFIVNML